MNRIRPLLRPRTLLVAGVVLFALIQLVPVWAFQTNPPAQSSLAWASPEAEAIARRACYDCHSNETVWPLYSRIAPASWLITYDVLKGRDELNFSQPIRDPAELAEEIAEVIREGEMPQRQYLLLHPEARLTPAEQQILIAGAPGAVGGAPAPIGDDD